MPSLAAAIGLYDLTSSRRHAHILFHRPLQQTMRPNAINSHTHTMTK